MLADVSLSDTPRSTLTRLRERARSDRADLYAVLDAGLICHLGLVRDGAPVVLPTGYARVDDTVYLHGSTGAGCLCALGVPPLDELPKRCRARHRPRGHRCGRKVVCAPGDR